MNRDDYSEEQQLLDQQSEMRKELELMQGDLEPVPMEQLEIPEAPELQNPYTQQRQDFEQAASQRDALNRQANLLRAFQQLATAGSPNVKPNMSVADDLSRQASLKTKDVQDKQRLDREKQFEMQTAQRMEQMGIKIDDMKDLRDPNFKLAKTFRDNAQMLFNKVAPGFEVPEDASIYDVNTMSELFKKRGAKGLTDYQKMMIELRKKDQELRERDIDRKEGQGDERIELSGKKLEQKVKEFEHKVSEKDELSDTQTANLIDFDKGKNIVNKIKDMYKKDNVQNSLGVYASALAEGKKFIPNVERDTDFVEMQALVGSQLAEYVKRISGAAVSEEEAQRLAKNIPSMNDKPKEFMRKLEMFENIIEDNRKITIDAYKKQGKDPSGFEKKQSDTVLIEAPKTGERRRVRKDAAQKYLGKGAKIVEGE